MLPDGQRQAYNLPAGPLRVGRDEHSNQIVVPASFTSVSRLHLELRPEPDGYHVLDLEALRHCVLKQRCRGAGAAEDGRDARDYLRNEAEVLAPAPTTS